MENGWIRYWRKSLKNPMFRNYKLWHFWDYCLLKANHQKNMAMIGYEQVKLEPGQFIFGRKKASKECGLSERTIRTCLVKLQNSQNLTIKTTNRYSIITIINWKTYQPDFSETTSKTTSKRPANDQQTTTNKNDKNDKNIFSSKKQKKIYTLDFEQFWKAYPSKVGKPYSFKCWQKIKNRPPLEHLLEAIKKQKNSRKWKEGFICNPSTWLNQGRWDDEVQESWMSKYMDES